MNEPTAKPRPTKPAKGPPARFAQGTDLPVAKTRGDIETMLQRHGAKQVLSGSDFESRAGFVGFTLGKRQIRFQLQPYQAKGVGRPQAPEQYEREMWRALLLIIRGKLEAVRSGVMTVEREFLANIVLPDGKLLGEQVEPALERMYETGQVGPLLPEDGYRRLGAG